MQAASAYQTEATSGEQPAYSYAQPRPIPFPYAPPPEPVRISPALLEQSLLPLIASQLEAVGFTHADKSATEWLQYSAIRLVQDLFERAKERAESECRDRVNAVDLWEVIEEEGGVRGGVDALGELVKARRGKPHVGIRIIPEEVPVPEPGLEAFEEATPETRLTYAPDHVPPLPSRHTYMFARPPPVKQTTTLASLDKSVAEALLAEQSLRGLMQALEETAESQTNGAAGVNGNAHGYGRGANGVVAANGSNGVIPASLGPVVNWERERMQGGKRWNIKRR